MDRGRHHDPARLEKLDEFRLFPAADPVGTTVYGPHLFGTIRGRWTVYKDPWLDVTGPGGGGVGGGEVMLLGYKGTTPLDTGYIYADADVEFRNAATSHASWIQDGIG